MRERLEDYVTRVAQRLQLPGVSVVNLGLVDSAEKGFAAGHRFRREDVDLIFLYVTTYALSSTVLPAVRRARVPVIVLNLQPEAAIYYAEFNRLGDRTKMTGEWLAYCSACPVPEIANVLRRAGVPFHQVTGTLEGDPECWRAIEEWVEAGRVAEILSHNHLGLMGHYYSGMLDIATDLARVSAVFGTHIEMLEVDELSEIRRTVDGSAVERRVEEFRTIFDLQAGCSAEELLRCARASVALDELVDRHQLNSMAYYYKGSRGSDNEETISSMILGASLLTARGIPVAGEYEVKNALAMKIMDAFGAGGSFTEYYALDFNDDLVLMGHDGPGHPGIAEGKTKVRALRVYHGKVGRGLSVEMSVRNGDVSLLSIAEDEQTGYKLIVAQGQSVPGPILQIGNTNSRYRFPVGAKKFVELWNAEGPAHHCAVGVGHIASKIEKLAKLLSLRFVQIC